MSKLFSEVRSVDENRSISVMDIPRGGVIVQGITRLPNGHLGGGNLNLSDEAADMLRKILNVRHKRRKKSHVDAKTP